MAATQPPRFDAEAAPPSVEAVREATRAVLPLVDLETVKEREVVAMVEQRLGAMVADTEPLRSAVQDEIDRCLLQDDELLMPSGASAPSAGGAAGAGAARAGAGSGGEPRKKAKPKRKRAGALDGFVVDDDADDEDYQEEEEEEEEEEGARDRPGAKKKNVTAAAARRYTKSEWAAARHDWSAPAPAPTANATATDATANANATATAPPIATIADEKVLAALSQLPEDKPKTAKSLASFLRAPKSDVNKALYRLERQGKAAKRADDGGAPAWTPVGAPREGGENLDARGPTSASGPASGPDAGRATETSERGEVTEKETVAGEVCALSESKRVTVGEYRGRKHVSLREFYCKDGAWLPGKKGINLSVEQWRGLKAAAPRVTARLRSGETSACVVAELGDGRRVTCGAFRGAVTVGVREYYEKNGEMLPGFRGLNMSAQQWDVFAARVEAIDAAIDGNAS